MKAIGISGSPRRGKTTDILVQQVLSTIECSTEFISLAGKKIAPCLACLACVKDNTCKIKDDMQDLREKVLEADALVIGAPNYFSALNGLTHCFLERLCQFRHQSGQALAGKYAGIISTGGLQPEIPGQMIEKMLPYYQIVHVGTINAQGAASCYTCGFGESCDVGAVHMVHGPECTITPDIIPDLSKQPEKIAEARLLGRTINRYLSSANRSN